ncbi:MAG TPA: LamG domain-containing protein [Bacteriovoracaceae bacterium]|nr:LamG domain-containing protein [Bacteriovoracaceae bacterium]
MTGYSRGSFRLAPSCIDPYYIPASGNITGTVTVSTDNVTVTGSGTTFLSEFLPLDYTEINGIYTQIKTVNSDTSITLNEISGNKPALIGTFTASKRMPSYGGIKVTKGAGAPPTALSTGWQPCDNVNQTILHGDLIDGANIFQFWVKDNGNNVATASVNYTVNYNAPVITVEDGPTISTNVAALTINACGGGTKISKVLFNETGVKPLIADVNWQVCSTTAGALSSMALSPGNHTLKAYFLYTDNFISENPVNVTVNYLPEVEWFESPLTIRPQTTYTLASCTGIDEVYVNQTTAPLAGAAGWQTCSTAPGAINYLLGTTGSQTVNVWYKSSGVVSPNFSQTTVYYIPPVASHFGSSIVNTTTPPLSIDTCAGISKVFVKLDEASPTAPSAGDFTASGVACNTALNGIIPPAVVGEGNHNYDVWFQFSDGYILTPWYSRVAITYSQVDTTPPPVAGGDVPISLTLDNGTGTGTVPGVQETIELNGSRANFSVNTCNPMNDFVLTGTVSVAAGGTVVTGSGTQFMTQLAVNDFIKIGSQSLKIKSIESNLGLTLILPHTLVASGVAASRVYPEDVIAGMILTETNVQPLEDNEFWLACSTTAGALKSPSLADGNYILYAWFKDAAGNVSGTNFSKSIIIDTSPDGTPPPRPLVTVVGAPTLVTSPALLTIASCTDVDQVYVEPSPNPAPYVVPNVGLSGWQDCSAAAGAISYFVDLRGSYTLAVWFKDLAGNVNPAPREVSFIFDPAIGNLPYPVAYWTMDTNHLNKNRVIDLKGDRHLYRWDPAQVTEVAGRDKQALLLSGTNSYLFTENTSVLKPATAVTLSMWAYLTNGDAATKGLAGNGSYGLKLDSGNLVFYASGTANTVSVATSSYTTGWRHIIGTSDGRYLKLFVDGRLVGTPLDLGSAANLTYLAGAQLFVVGGLVDGVSNNPKSTNLFDNKVDEVVVWNQFFTPEMAMVHYIDTFNLFKVKQDAIPPANITTASFHADFLQNAQLSITSCGGAKFIYVDETTHPPVAGSTRWQLCNTMLGGILHANLAQGPHELKVWGKDEYENISTGYQLVDTTITSLTYQPDGVAYYTLDNGHSNITAIQDIFSGQTALAVGADAGQTAIQGEGYGFVRASSDFIERMYAFNSQPKDHLTMSIWANLLTNDSVGQVLAGTRSAGHGYSIEIDASKLRFIVETSGGARFAEVATSSYPSGFHNVVAMYDGKYAKLYIDGIEVNNVDYTSVEAVQYTCLGSFMIGAGSSCNLGPVAGTHFNGTLDEVTLWDAALSAATISDIFNGSDTIPPDPVAVTPKLNDYSVDVPIARFNAANCTDGVSVYASIGTARPPSNVANWQACATTGDQIRSPLLNIGSNLVKFWFRDMAGNVSLTSTDLTVNYTYDFTVPDPKSYWTFDKVNVDGAVAKDVIGAKHGAITGAVEIAGKVSEARSLDGNDLIEVPFNVIHQPTNEVTLSVWFKAPSYGVGTKYLAGNLSSGGYALVLNGNALEFKVVVNGTTLTISETTVGLNTAIWHHAVGVYATDGTLRLFLDNVEKLPAVTAGSVSKLVTYTNSNSFVIGAGAPVSTGNSGNFFTGSLDEVAFWDQALSDTVIAEIFDRGNDDEQVYYNVVPPQIPVSLAITYYNSLVSRANLTVSSCTGLDYIIVTKDEFPPDKNDADWQICNTLTGGLLSKELSSSDSFGKLWTKDNFGNVSRTFEYVAVSTAYDKSISRPIVHWTFDNAHYVAGTKTAFDRLSQINLKSETLQTYTGTCQYIQSLDPATSSLITNNPGVLNQSFTFGNMVIVGAPTKYRPTILRANHPENIKTKPTTKLSVAAWVKLTLNDVTVDRHIVSNMTGTAGTGGARGWALRLHAPSTTTGGIRFTVITDQGTVEPYLETVNIATGWHLVTGTFDGQTASLFMDGIFVKSFSLPAQGNIIYDTAVNTFVGSQASVLQTPTRFVTHNDSSASCVDTGTQPVPDNSYFNNSIDEVIIWDKALTKLEVSSLYHNGADILYSTDTIAPVRPTLSQENTRPDMFTNKAHFTLSSCNTGEVVSGVLVNEGTQPDKQDERWETCRTRPGSFGLLNLTPAGHTITAWFKDLAGNVTPASTDLVVNYITGTLPSANALWPLDSTHTVSKYSRDVIDNKLHDLMTVNFETPLNPGAVHVVGKVNEGMHLASTSTTNGSFLHIPTSKYLRPVNYFSIGGWFYLTNSDASQKTLIDHHRWTSSTNRGGYAIDLYGSQLRFYAELDIVGQRILQVPTSSYATGWHHVVGVFTGLSSKLYLDGVQVVNDGPYAERDFLRWDNLATEFKVGADFNDNANPYAFFGEKVDEIGLWGFDLTGTQVGEVVTGNNASLHAYAPVPNPINVNNAFIYHYDNFASRARMTVLDCTNVPYVFVTARNAAVPADDHADWRNCRTEPGAILSTKLPLNTTFVDVYAKSSDGVISPVAGWKEINPIGYDYDLVMPITYFSFNSGHLSGGFENDFVVNAKATLTGATRVANLDGHAINLGGASNQYIDIPTEKIFDLRDGLTISLWADITNGDTTTRRIVSRNGTANVDDTAILLEGGYLKFRINVASFNNNWRSVVYIDAFYPTSLISTDRHHITASYDGFNLKLYLDSMLVATANPGIQNYLSSSLKTLAMDTMGGFRLGAASNSLMGKVDEFMVFDRILTEAQIVTWYRRQIDILLPSDVAPPALGRTLTVHDATFGTDWPTDDANPLLTINNCSDISGVFMNTTGILPAVSDTGWQICQTQNASLVAPTLAAGPNTIYFYYKDRNGNISGPQSIPVNYTIPVSRPNPVAYWNFDDDSLVGSKIYEPINQIHANTFGIISTDFVTATEGKGIQFDGKRKYVEISHNPIIKPTEEWSVSFSVDVPSTLAGRAGRTILGNRAGNTSEGFSFRWSCQTAANSYSAVIPTACYFPEHEYFEFWINIDNVEYLLDYPQSQLGTGYKHIVATFNGRFIRLYSNGVKIRERDLISKRSIYYHPTNNTSLIVGARASAERKPLNHFLTLAGRTDYHFEGIIDEVAIYNTALYPAHVADIYTNFIGTNTRVYDPAYTVITPPNTRTTIYESGKKSFGSRLKLTISDCTDMQMVLVNNSIVAPSANDENWQPCNTYAGGIVSAPLGSNTTVTPKVWAKSLTGQVSASYGTANGATYALRPYSTDIPRPKVLWSLDSTYSNHSTATGIRDVLGQSDGVHDLLGTADSNVIQLAGTLSVTALSTTVTGTASSFMTQLAIGDRVRIADEILQVQSITDNFTFTSVNTHRAGATLSQAYRIGSVSGSPSVLEGGFIFNGINDMISVRPNAATNPFYNLTISAWVELKRGDTLHRHIVGNLQNGVTGTGAGTGLQVKNGKLEFFVTAWTGFQPIYTQSAYYSVGIDTNLYSTGLHHVTGTYDGVDLNLYLDGAFVKRFSIPFFVPTTYQTHHDDYSHWTIGAETSTANAGLANSFFYGVIDDVNIWHKKLTPEQIYYAYEYGADNLVAPFPDGVAPTDPGVFLADGLTNRDMPWAYFTMPSCVGANSFEINAIWIGTSTDPAPTTDDAGWQFCSMDSAYHMSKLLNPGSSDLKIYFRDEQGDVSATPTTVPVTYTPPKLIHPNAYYTFDVADRVDNSPKWTYLDKAGTKHVRQWNNSIQTFTGGKVGHFWSRGSSYAPVTKTLYNEYDSVKDYTAALWYYPEVAITSEGIILDQGQYQIIRTTDDRIKVITKTATGGPYTNISTARIAPNTWTHVAVTRSSGRVSIFLNGVIDSSHVIGSGNLAENLTLMSFGQVQGHYDELVMYTSSLTKEQVAYVYYKGMKTLGIDIYSPNVYQAKSPNFYWNFDTTSIAGGYLDSLVNPLPMKIVNAVTSNVTGANAIKNESFFFARGEDVGDGTNPVRAHQYLESDSAAPISLGQNFTMSIWVKQPTARGYYAWNGHPENDQTAIIDMWGADAADKSFHLGYWRGSDNTFTQYYTASVWISGVQYAIYTDYNHDLFNTNNVWVNLAVRRKGKVLTLFVNGVQAGGRSDLPLTNVQVPVKSRLRFGDSSLYGFYYKPGTVSVTAGTAAVTGAGTTFMTDLFETKAGTLTVAPGGTAVTGSGTAFNTDFVAGNKILINGELRTIATVPNLTTMTLTVAHTAGAAGVAYSKLTTKDLLIKNQWFEISTVTSDTTLTLATNHTLGATAETYALNISEAAASDEYGFNGYLDEFAIWDTSLTQRQIYEFKNKGAAGAAIPYQPIGTIVGENGSATVNSDRAKISINDCRAYTHVWVGNSLDLAPLDTDVGNATYPGWIACDPNVPLDSPMLAINSVNNLRLWFKTGTVVDIYTTDVGVTHSSGDTSAPIIPTVTLTTSNVTSDPFALFTVSSCADIAGVFVGNATPTPTALQAGWKNCTTVGSGISSNPMSAGVNNISIWFKDAVGNISASTDFAITYTEDALPPASLFLTMDDAQITTASKYQRDITGSDLAISLNTSTLTTGFVGTVNQAIELNNDVTTNTAYYYLPFNDISLTNTMSFFTWVNLDAPTVDAQLIGRWDGTAANDSYSIRINSSGRLCLDFQNTSSTGVWNTTGYRRVCSSFMVPFASWNHVGLIRNGSTVQFFINNQLAGSETIDSSNFKATTAQLRIGAQAALTSGLDGMIDELGIWNSVLNSDERKNIYAKNIAGVSAFSEPVSTDPGVNPDNYWKFETGSELAATYGGINFTTVSGTHQTTGGQVNGHYLYASSSFQSMQTAATSINLAGDFTISAWVNPVTNVVGDIINKWNTGDVTAQSFKLGTNGTGQVIFNCRTTTPATFTMTSIQTIPTGQWSHISVARKGKALYLYINGIPQAVTDLGSTIGLIDNATVPLSVGGNTIGGNSYFNGRIDDISIYQSYLIERKIKFNISKGLAGDPVVP